MIVGKKWLNWMQKRLATDSLGGLLAFWRGLIAKEDIIEMQISR